MTEHNTNELELKEESKDYQYELVEKPDDVVCETVSDDEDGDGDDGDGDDGGDRRNVSSSQNDDDVKAGDDDVKAGDDDVKSNDKIKEGRGNDENKTAINSLEGPESQNNHIGGAALIGGVAGLIVGPIGAVVGAGTAAIVAKSCKCKVGDVMRSSGGAVERKLPDTVKKTSSRAFKATSTRVINASIAVREFDDKHTKVSERLRNVDEKHGIVQKVQNTSTKARRATSNGVATTNAKFREINEKHKVSERLRDADKKHRVSERSSQVMKSVSNRFRNVKDVRIMKSFHNKKKEGTTRVELTA